MAKEKTTLKPSASEEKGQGIAIRRNVVEAENSSLQLSPAENCTLEKFSSQLSPPVKFTPEEKILLTRRQAFSLLVSL